MRFVKRISLFVICPLLAFSIGIFAGVQLKQLMYREQNMGVENVPSVQEEQPQTIDRQGADSAAEGQTLISEASQSGQFKEASARPEKLTVDTEYVLEETDMDTLSVVETTWRLPEKYVGMTREQFLTAMELYELSPPLAEKERGFVSLEVLSFSVQRVVVQMNYHYVQPTVSFYLAARDNQVIVYLEDKQTVYIETGIQLETLPEELRLAVMQSMLWIENEEVLYNFLETYSS